MPELRADPDLRRLAEAATNGPWQAEDREVLTRPSDQRVNAWHGNPPPTVVATARRALNEQDVADAAYIAALSPDRVLALLDRLAALEGALGELALTGNHAPDCPAVQEARAALAGTPKP